MCDRCETVLGSTGELLATYIPLHFLENADTVATWAQVSLRRRRCRPLCANRAVFCCSQSLVAMAATSEAIAVGIQPEHLHLIARRPRFQCVCGCTRRPATGNRWECYECQRPCCQSCIGWEGTLCHICRRDDEAAIDGSASLKHGSSKHARDGRTAAPRGVETAAVTPPTQPRFTEDDP